MNFPTVDGKPAAGLEAGDGEEGHCNEWRQGEGGQEDGREADDMETAIVEVSECGGDGGNGWDADGTGRAEVVEEEDGVESVVDGAGGPLPETFLEAPEGAEGGGDPEDVAAVGGEG